MSKYLLDTHIFLWALLEPERLSPAVVSLINDSANEIWISPISVWEIIILAEKGRIVLDDEPVSWTKNVLRSLPVREAPLNNEVAWHSRSVQLPHQDPADRFIAATAAVYGLTLITSDNHLLEAAVSYTALANK